MGFTDVLKKAFPFLSIAASIVPGGNIATTVLGQVLNLKSGATMDDAGLALLNATPEQRAALMAEENRHKEVMQQMGIQSAEQFEQIAAGDRASARQREMTLKDRVPSLLALLVTVGFFGVLAFMMGYSLPTQGHDALLVMLGSLGTAWTAVVAYYFGSSAGSDRKTELLAQAPAVPPK